MINYIAEKQPYTFTNNRNNMDIIVNSQSMGSGLNETTGINFNSKLLDDGTLFSSYIANTLSPIDLENNSNNNNDHNNSLNNTESTSYPNHLRYIISSIF